MIVLAAVTGCDNVPDYVIQPEEMAQLMADIHTGEAVVDANYSDFRSDSARTLMKQSVLARHGVTFEQLDTSFMWYGQHLDVYNKVYDRTIQILQDRIAAASQQRDFAHQAEAGDSANVWTGSSRYVMHRGMPGRIITFDLQQPQNRPDGDIYTLRARFTNIPSYVRWTVMADYTDGSVEVLSTRFSGDGWHQTTFYLDSLKTATRLYGSVEVPECDRGVTFIDSMQLIRKDLQPRLYPQRYRQRAYSNQ